MPVRRDPKTGKWRIGNGPAMYKSKKKAEDAYAAYRAKQHDKSKNN